MKASAYGCLSLYVHPVMNRRLVNGAHQLEGAPARPATPPPTPQGLSGKEWMDDRIPYEAKCKEETEDRSVRIQLAQEFIL